MYGITICSALMLLIIVIIMTTEKDKEKYGDPPGMLPAESVQDMQCCYPPIAAASKEMLPRQSCKQEPECYRGWSAGPLEYQANSASSISHMIERSA